MSMIPPVRLQLTVADTVMKTPQATERHSAAIDSRRSSFTGRSNHDVNWLLGAPGESR